METDLTEEALAAALREKLLNATQRYEKERGAKPPLPQLPPSNETGSLHLFLGSAPRVKTPPPVAMRKTTKKKPEKRPETLPYVGPYRAFSDKDDFTHIKTDRKHRVVRVVERPKTPDICVDKPDEWANFELPEGFDLQKWLAEDPEQYDEWLLYHKGIGPKPIKHVVSDEAKALLAAGDKVDLGELMDEAVPRYPVTSKLEFGFNDDASVSSEEEEVEQEVVQVKARGLKGLKQRLSAMSHLRSFAKNDPGPGTTTYKLEEDARRFVGAGARKRFFGRLRLCHQQREIVPANVVHVKEYGDADTVETEESSTIVSSEESTTLGSGTTADGRRRLKELTLINMPKPEDDSVVTEEPSTAISYTTWQTPSGDVDDNLLTREAMTPRQKYLREILRKKALPYPVLCRRRKDKPGTLDLTGAGVGDVIIESLAQVLDGLHDVDTLLLADNRLTDLSLDPLLEAIASLPHLTSLDLSGAKMDASSAKLREYLASDECALRSLVMSRADVDDWECADFMVLTRRP
jgi:hypothetical protein